MARLLLVDNDETFLDLGHTVLTEAGHEVHLARDGSEGFRRIAEGTVEYDVILCDLHMPRMNGADFLRQARPLIRRVTPVILVSGVAHLIDGLGQARFGAYCVLNKPLKQLSELTDVVAHALEQRRTYVELREQREENDRLRKRIGSLIEQNELLFGRARLDPLTDLPNRKRLEDDLNVLHANALRYPAPFAVAVFDIDDFTRINKEFGLRGGDRVVHAVAQTLRAACREGDTVYRYAGDEFVLILAGQHLEAATYAAQRAVELVAETPVSVRGGAGGPQVQMTVSCGVSAMGTGRSKTPADLLREADEHLGEAKSAGGNCCRPSTRIPLEA